MKNRPAETTAIAFALALLIARTLGVDDVDTVTAVAIVIGGVPAVVTWIVELMRGKVTAEVLKNDDENLLQ